ncbi:MAG: gliding motility-associated C-terminal domain-containing protein [candidate division WOR-3 bacterium]
MKVKIAKILLIGGIIGLLSAEEKNLSPVSIYKSNPSKPPYGEPSTYLKKEKIEVKVKTEFKLVEPAKPLKGENILGFGWFSNEVYNSATPGTDDGYDHWPSITTDGYGYLWAAYSASQGLGSNKDTVYIFYSPDKGNTWYLRLKWYSTDTLYGVFCPTISANKGDNYIYLDAALGEKANYSFLAGLHFSLRFQHTGGGNVSDIYTTPISSYDHYVNGAIAADGTPNSPYVYLVVIDWSFDPDAAVDFYRSSDRGTTWELVHSESFYDAITSAIDATPKYSSQGAFFAYWRYDGTNSRIWVAEADPASFSGWNEIDVGGNVVRWPVRVAWNGTKRIVIWEEHTANNNSDIYYRYNTGTGWSQRMIFDNTTRNFVSPDIAISSDGTAFLGIVRDENGDYWGHPAVFASTDYINWTTYKCNSDTTYDYDVIQEYNGHGEYLGTVLCNITTIEENEKIFPSLIWRRVQNTQGGGDPWFSGIQPIYSVSVEPDQTGNTMPGVSIDYLMAVTNNGNFDDIYNLSTSGTLPNWTAEIYDSAGTTPITTIAVNCKSTKYVRLRITPPPDAQMGVCDTTFLIAISSQEVSAKDSARAITCIQGVAGILIEPDTMGSTSPGVSINYMMRAINNGNLLDTINLTLYGTSPGWTSEIFDSTGTTPINKIVVPAFSTRRFILKITPPQNAPAGSADTTIVKGISSFNPSVSDTATVITNIISIASILIEPDTTGEITPGQTLNYYLRVINNGNSLDSISLSLTSFHPSGWNTELLDTLGNPINFIKVPPFGGMKRIILRVYAPPTAGSGERDSSIITGVSSINPSVSDKATIITYIGLIANIIVEPNQTKSGLPGELVKYRVFVRNLGNAQDLVDLSLTSSKNWADPIIRDTLGNIIPDNDGDGKQDLVLGVGETKWVEVWVYIPSNAQAGTQDTTIITGESNNIQGVKDNAILITKVLPQIISLIVDPDQTQKIPAGTQITYNLYAILKANTADTVKLTLSSPPPKWQAFLSVNKIWATPYDTIPFNVIVKAPKIDIIGPPEEIIDSFHLIVKGISKTDTNIYDIAEIITLVYPELDCHNFASPFKSSKGTTFIFSLPEKGKVTITVYNRLGEKIKDVIKDKEYNAGIHTYYWDGKNEKGNKVSPGVYVYIFKFEGETIRGERGIIRRKTAVIGD